MFSCICIYIFPANAPRHRLRKFQVMNSSTVNHAESLSDCPLNEKNNNNLCSKAGCAIDDRWMGGTHSKTQTWNQESILLALVSEASLSGRRFFTDGAADRVWLSSVPPGARAWRRRLQIRDPALEQRHAGRELPPHRILKWLRQRKRWGLHWSPPIPRACEAALGHYDDANVSLLKTQGNENLKSERIHRGKTVNIPRGTKSHYFHTSHESPVIVVSVCLGFLRSQQISRLWFPFPLSVLCLCSLFTVRLATPDLRRKLFQKEPSSFETAKKLNHGVSKTFYYFYFPHKPFTRIKPETARTRLVDTKKKLPGSRQILHKNAVFV